MHKDWIDTSLDDPCQFKGGNAFKEHLQGKKSGLYPFIKVSDMTLQGNEKFIIDSNNWIDDREIKEMGIKLMAPNSVVFAKVGAALKLNKRRILTRPTAIDNNMMAAIPDTNKIDPEYLYYFMLTQDLGRLCQESAVPSINQQHLSEILISLPPVIEQKKIAIILCTWDDAVATTQTLIEKKKEFLSWIQREVCTGKTRIIKTKKEWVRTKLSSVLNEHRKKSTLKELVHSVSVHKGVINQIEHLGRSFAAPSTDKYNLVHFGDMVYTKSPTGDFPWGIIKQSLKPENVIVSPLYGVFTPIFFELGVVLDFIFESNINTTNYLNPLVQKGAKNTINITNKRFLEGSLLLPADHNEIKKIAHLIETRRNEIKILERKLQKIKVQKRGLMQKLLTGKWSVNLAKKEA